VLLLPVLLDKARDPLGPLNKIDMDQTHQL
jgi:hypothetical protein